MAHPLRSLVNDWLAVIEFGKTAKQERFGQYADECEKFYDGAHNWMWHNTYSRGPQGFVETAGEIPYPTFHMTVNRVFEAVAIFGPAMFQRYPQGMVTPVTPPIVPPEMFGLAPEDPEYASILFPQEQDKRTKGVVAGLLQHYLNWLQIETNKKGTARKAITDALVTGLGLTFTEWHQPDGATLRCPRNRHISWRQLIKDPDATFEEDVQWIAIDWISPVNLVEEKFGLPAGSLKGNLQSGKSQTSRHGQRDVKSNTKGDSFDLIRYFDVYSRNGMGDKLKRYKAQWDLSSLGKYTRIVVAKGVDYPLNMPESIMTDEEAVIDSVQWPIPFWQDSTSGNGWPTTELSYYDKIESVWPVSLFKPAIGELRFVNWCMSFLADKVAASSHEYVAILKSAAKDIKEQLLNQKGPIKLIELTETVGMNINQVIGLLQKPNFDEGIFKMVESVMNMIDKRTGLTELVYGLSGSQMRSATEAGIKNDRVSVRPDDMAEKTDDWYSAGMSKEAMTLAWLGQREDVIGPMGMYGSDIFDRLVFGADPEMMVRDFSYRIAAGSARKPNKAMILQSLNEFGQVAAPVLQSFAQQGIVEPWNAYAFDIAKALDLPEPERYMVRLPPPEEKGPTPEEMDAQLKQQEMVMDAQQHGQEMMQDEESHEQEMAQEREKMKLDIQLGRQKITLARQQAKAKASAATSNGKAKAS